MKCVRPIVSSILVALGVFFIVGWCLLPAPQVDQPEESRVDRLRVLAKMDWKHNTWGYVLGPLIGVAAGWLTFRQAKRESAS